MKKILLPLFALTASLMVNAQESKKPEVSLVFGLNQPLVTKGFNFEVDYWTKKFVFDYSHGFGLEFTDNLVTKEAQDQHLAFNITHSVGFGLGYRFTEKFNVRVEPKMHVWEMYYDDTFKQADSRIKKYTTYTLGLGAYYRWTPFENKQNALRGLTIVPNVRWWPNVGSSLKDNTYTYFNERTQQTETHKANNIGVSNTPFFINVSVGYTFNLRHQS